MRNYTINRGNRKLQRTLFLSLLILLMLMFNSCTAILSTSNSVGSSISALFSSPKKIENKITDPVRNDARLAVLWVGHATFLIQIDNKFILTDPVFTETTAFISKRLTEPGLDPENLPEIDVVLISHLHADHLSIGSLDMIESKVKELLVPQEGLVYIPNFDFESDELKTWHTWEKDGLKITAVPVLHNGMRYGIDAEWLDKSFTGYIIQYDGITVYFSGDTGYEQGTTIFKETGKRFPNIDLALLPISPIHPREYSKGRHTGPVDAIKIMDELNAKKMIPMHFDTFPESYDSLGEAESRMREAMKENNLTKDKIIILKIGEQKVIIPK
ncbi:MAG: MBL fold metallo-hydrolase [Chlorobi bacterium]|nr:MBL fold metallo-hydrolase [Chlorobiota bacterium]